MLCSSRPFQGQSQPFADLPMGGSIRSVHMWNQELVFNTCTDVVLCLYQQLYFAQLVLLCNSILSALYHSCWGFCISGCFKSKFLFKVTVHTKEKTESLLSHPLNFHWIFAVKQNCSVLLFPIALRCRVVKHGTQITWPQKYLYY